MEGSRMRRLLVAALFTLTWGLVASVPAAAAEVHVPFCGLFTGAPVLNCTFTQTLHGQVSVDPLNVNPCSLVVGTATMITNSIVHVTVNGAGDVWITQTATSHFTFVPNSAGPPSYRGEFTFWFGESLNKNNSVSHDIGNIVLHGSDGSRLTLHLVDHVSVSASGVQNQFSIARMTCP
jgi:hypothetical protein